MIPRYTVRELADAIGGVLQGDGDSLISGVADLSEAESHQASWVSNPKYAAQLAQSRAGLVLVPSDFGPTPMPALLCERVDRSVARLLSLFAPPVSRPEPGIHATAVVHDTADIGADTAIGPHAVIDAQSVIGAGCVIHSGVFIGRDTRIGAECVIWPNVVIRDGCVIGNRVTIHSNAVIGADGLGFYFDEGRHVKVPHIGGVLIEDDVEIGACTCIDRAKFGFTRVGRGTKIDNLVQLAHNVRVGEHCMLAGQVGISGSVRIGNRCVFGGKAAAADNLTIGDGARLAGGLAVATKDIPAGSTVSGFPARDHRQGMREQALVHRLPSLLKQLTDLTARVERLEAATNNQPRGGV